MRETGLFRAVEAGYLNYSTPPIEDAVARCQQAGATRIIIAPYFLIAGKFVRVDLPARLKPLVAANPQLEIKLARAIEDSLAMLPLSRDLLAETREPRQWQLDGIAHARQQCELRQTCPIYGSEMCRAEVEASGDGELSKWRRSVAALEGEMPGGGSATTASHSASNSGESPSFERAGKRGLLLILHGSPHPEANGPALILADRMRSERTWSQVNVAYLECNEPDIHTALDDAGAAGITQLDVLPYFLHPGRHLVVDIGNALQAAMKRWPQMRIGISPAVGESPRLPAVLIQRLQEAMG